MPIKRIKLESVNQANFADLLTESANVLRGKAEINDIPTFIGRLKAIPYAIDMICEELEKVVLDGIIGPKKRIKNARNSNKS